MVNRHMKRRATPLKHQGNANQNHNEISAHIGQDGWLKSKTQETSVG